MNPRIGVGVFVFNEKGQFVLGQRKGSHGAGHWGLPGGHLEFKETIPGCAEREVLEEIGLEVSNIRFLTATNDIMEAENKHYVTLFVGCESTDLDKEPEVLEPLKCSSWKWTTWEELTSWESVDDKGREKGALFIPLTNLMSQHPGCDPWEAWKSAVGEKNHRLVPSTFTFVGARLSTNRGHGSTELVWDLVYEKLHRMIRKDKLNSLPVYGSQDIC